MIDLNDFTARLNLAQIAFALSIIALVMVLFIRQPKDTQKKSHHKDR